MFSDGEIVCECGLCVRFTVRSAPQSPYPPPCPPSQDCIFSAGFAYPVALATVQGLEECIADEESGVSRGEAAVTLWLSVISVRVQG